MENNFDHSFGFSGWRLAAFVTNLISEKPHNQSVQQSDYHMSAKAKSLRQNNPLNAYSTNTDVKM